MLRLTDGPTQMPMAEGLRHLVRELLAGVPKPEILITSWNYHGRYFGTKDHPAPKVDGPTAPIHTPWEPTPTTHIASRSVLCTSKPRYRQQPSLHDH